MIHAREKSLKRRSLCRVGHLLAASASPHWGMLLIDEQDRKQVERLPTLLLYMTCLESGTKTRINFHVECVCEKAIEKLQNSVYTYHFASHRDIRA